MPSTDETQSTQNTNEPPHVRDARLIGMVLDAVAAEAKDIEPPGRLSTHKILLRVHSKGGDKPRLEKALKLVHEHVKTLKHDPLLKVRIAPRSKLDPNLSMDEQATETALEIFQCGYLNEVAATAKFASLDDTKPAARTGPASTTRTGATTRTGTTTRNVTFASSNVAPQHM